MTEASTTEASERGGLQVELTEQAETRRVLAVEVPAARVDRAFSQAYQQLGRSARVKGFRPGKIPRTVLQKLYGAAVAEDLERTLVGESLAEALERTDVQPVSEPRIEAPTPAPGEPFRYTVQVEVRPTIELGDLKGLPARRPPDTVEEADVERELESLRERQSQLVEEPEDTPAAPGHRLDIDFIGRIDGEPFEGGRGEDVTFELGSGQMLPEFDAGLAGARAGESRTLSVHFPDDYRNEALAGRDAEFEVQVRSIRRREVPELDDDFAKDLGDFEDLDALREKLREQLQAHRAREVQSALRRSVLDSLIDRTPFEVPPGAVEERLRRRIHSARHELEERGLPPQWIDTQLAGSAEAWREGAEREVREQWLLEEVARSQSIEPDEDAVEAELERMLEGQEGERARLRKAYRDAGFLDALRRRQVEERAVEFLLGEAKVETFESP